MSFKPIGKFWKRRSQAGSTYYAFKPLKGIPAGSRVMLFRRDDSDDDSAGNVCIAVDDEQQPQQPTNPGGQHRCPPTDGAADPGGFRRETVEIASNPSPLDTPF